MSHLLGCRIILKEKVVQVVSVNSIFGFFWFGFWYRNIFINNCIMFVYCPLWKSKYDSKAVIVLISLALVTTSAIQMYRVIISACLYLKLGWTFYSARRYVLCTDENNLKH